MLNELALAPDYGARAQTTFNTYPSKVIKKAKIFQLGPLGILGCFRSPVNWKPGNLETWKPLVTGVR